MVFGVAIAAMALYALTHALKHVNYGEVAAAVEHTNPGAIALALLLVAVSYGSLTVYDLLALRTIGRSEVPYRIAALASFTIIRSRTAWARSRWSRPLSATESTW